MNAAWDAFLLALLRASGAGALLVLLVLATQRVFQRQFAPRWHAALWLLVAVRLVPFSVPSPVSAFNLLSRHRAGAPIPSFVSPTQTGGSFEASALPVSTTDRPAAADSGHEPREIHPEEVSNWNGWRVFFTIWILGALVLALYVVIGFLRFVLRLRRLSPVADEQTLALWRECCTSMGVRNVPRLWEDERMATPALQGVFRPQLLLPMGFVSQVDARDLRLVFLHELAHVRRQDLLVNWVTTGLQIVHWFNPVIWFGFARWRLDRESACDAEVLERTGDPHEYGETMVRLLENLAAPGRGPGLVGMLDGRKDLRVRMTRIANFTPGRQPFAAVGLLIILGLVGLTDAQVSAPANPATFAPVADSTSNAPATLVPQPTAGYTLFLVNGSETLLMGSELTNPGNARDYAERGRTFVIESGAAAEAGASPKWQMMADTLERMLRDLPATLPFHIVVFGDDRLEAIGNRATSDDVQAIPAAITRLKRMLPHGHANLEAAFAYGMEAIPPPASIVLLTDSLPTANLAAPAEREVSEAQRIQFFTAATRRLPPRIPVHTVLLPMPSGDPGAAGLYWELANATRGRLTVPAPPRVALRTHLAFVVDTSGSMRNPNNGALWPSVLDAVEATLDGMPDLVGVQLLDADGRFMLGRRGNGSAAWLPVSRETREAIRQVLGNYPQDTISNPVPGVRNALRFLRDASGLRMGIVVLGDEFNSGEPVRAVLNQLETLNPPGPSGTRDVTIGAIGFPTTIRYKFSMGNTGLRFANLMRLVAQAHGGSFVGLQDL